MSIQFIETPGGRMAVIPEAEYNILIEETADTQAASHMLARIKRGEEELVPADVVERLALGDQHPIRVWRDYRGLKGKDLAALADISPVYLSEIENRKKDGSLKVCVRLARALNVDLDDLVE